jgi:hypothetical protein
MPSDKAALGVELKRIAVYPQNCILGLVLASKNPQCSVNFTDSIAKPNHAQKGQQPIFPAPKVGPPSPPQLPLPQQLLPSHCRRHLTLQRLLATRSRSSSCPLLSSSPWTPCLLLLQGQRRRGRRPLLRLLLQPHPTMHQLQCHHRLPPRPQRRASQPARRSLPSPSTFGCR